jgi:SAM-dependent methyltransferase
MSEAWSERARSFDARAAQYEEVRPGYPESAVDEILRFGELAAGSRALEVGCGTGKATRLFLARGLELTCLEPGPKLIEVARAACPGRVRFEPAKFEDWPLERGAYDLVFAAQSFHWVDARTGYAKAGQALRAGGTLALFWNRPREVASELRSRLDELYEARAPGLDELTPEVLARVEESIAASIAATGLFEGPQRRGFRFSQRLPSLRYVALLETYSAHAVLPDAQRRHLLSGVAELVDAAGGEIEVHYETVVHLARRT